MGDGGNPLCPAVLFQAPVPAGASCPLDARRMTREPVLPGVGLIGEIGGR